MNTPGFEPGSVTAVVDLEGRLIKADALIELLQQEAGADLGDPVAIPQLASLIWLVSRLKVPVSRQIMALDDGGQVTLWVKASLDEDVIRIDVTDWSGVSEQTMLTLSRDGSDQDDRDNRVADGPAAPVDIRETSLLDGELEQALRQPLQKIIADAEAIHQQSDGPLRPDYVSYASDIAVAGRHLLALVQDLSELQLIERADFKPEIEEIDLADVARRAVGLLSVRAADSDVRLDAPRYDETIPCRGDFGRVLQIVVNLLSNAIRYSPAGGMVWVRVEQDGPVAALIVADQGKGISDEDQKRIFDKFEQINPGEAGGSGLGLYISRTLARAMGGDLAVDSAPGQGARFFLTLPIT